MNALNASGRADYKHIDIYTRCLLGSAHHRHHLNPVDLGIPLPKDLGIYNPHTRDTDWPRAASETHEAGEDMAR